MVQWGLKREGMRRVVESDEVKKRRGRRLSRERERGIGVRFGEVEEDRIDIRPEIQGCRTLLNTFYSVSHFLLVFNPHITSQSEPLPLLQFFFFNLCFFLSLSLCHTSHPTVSA